MSREMAAISPNKQGLSQAVFVCLKEPFQRPFIREKNVDESSDKFVKVIIQQLHYSFARLSQMFIQIHSHTDEYVTVSGKCFRKSVINKWPSLVTYLTICVR